MILEENLQVELLDKNIQEKLLKKKLSRETLEKLSRRRIPKNNSRKKIYRKKNKRYFYLYLDEKVLKWNQSSSSSKCFEWIHCLFLNKMFNVLINNNNKLLIKNTNVILIILINFRIFQNDDDAAFFKTVFTCRSNTVILHLRCYPHNSQPTTIVIYPTKSRKKKWYM